MPEQKIMPEPPEPEGAVHAAYAHDWQLSHGDEEARYYKCGYGPCDETLAVPMPRRSRVEPVRSPLDRVLTVLLRKTIEAALRDYRDDDGLGVDVPHDEALERAAAAVLALFDRRGVQ